MDQTAKLLSRVAKNARTSLDAADRLLMRAQDAKMVRELELERDYYRDGDDAVERRRGEAHEVAEKSLTERTRWPTRASGLAVK